MNGFINIRFVQLKTAQIQFQRSYVVFIYANILNLYLLAGVRCFLCQRKQLSFIDTRKDSWIFGVLNGARFIDL